MIIDLTLRDLLIVMASATALLLILFVVLGRIMANISFTVNIVISPASQPLSAVTDPLNLKGTVGQTFSASLASNVQGGTPPYKLTTTGTLPDGIADDGSGNLSGTPTTAGTTTLSVSVNDSGA